jgi:hypothetical protein
VTQRPWWPMIATSKFGMLDLTRCSHWGLGLNAGGDW